MCLLKSVSVYEKYQQQILMSEGCYYRLMEPCTILGQPKVPAQMWPRCKHQHLLGTCKAKAGEDGRPRGSGIIPIQECIYLGFLNGRWTKNGRKEIKLLSPNISPQEEVLGVVFPT